ncbi:MAG: hypothetical protein F4X36_21570 [Gammaproteobacteria bacterium]|nr:hypothetical protein [Gammaproteobacteria bacterium]
MRAASQKALPDQNGDAAQFLVGKEFRNAVADPLDYLRGEGPPALAGDPDLLQCDDIRLPLVQPVQEILEPTIHAVHGPGCDLHRAFSVTIEARFSGGQFKRSRLVHAKLIQSNSGLSIRAPPTVTTTRVEKTVHNRERRVRRDHGLHCGPQDRGAARGLLADEREDDGIAPACPWARVHSCATNVATA